MMGRHSQLESSMCRVLEYNTSSSGGKRNPEEHPEESCPLIARLTEGVPQEVPVISLSSMCSFSHVKKM